MPTPRFPLRYPKLPAAQQILPYIRRIDSSRLYSNFGPLSEELELRLADRFGIDHTQIQLTSNATLGLQLALQSLGIAAGKYCAVPSLTFPGSICAILQSGFKPYFVDIDPGTMQVTPEIVSKAFQICPEIAAVMPVSFFGAPLDSGQWLRFESESGVRCIFDAAWCFDSLQTTSIPSVVSLHATKCLGVGEGGLVTCESAELIEEIKWRSNFGMTVNREIKVEGTNAKMSEYAAAVGLACLDSWELTRSLNAKVSATYQEELANLPDLKILNPHLDSVTGTICLLTEQPVSSEQLMRMYDAGAEIRFWWGTPCHTKEAFKRYPGQDLVVTDLYARRVLNLPYSTDFSGKDIADIVTILRRNLNLRSK